MRIIAIAVFGISALIFMALASVSMSTIFRMGGWSWRPDNVAYTFVPMLAFTSLCFFAQIRATSFSLLLLLEFLLLVGLLVITALYHAFPETSKLFGGMYLVAIMGFSAWEVYRLVAR